MQSFAAILVLFAAVGQSHLVSRSTPYTCFPEAKMTYEQGVALQSAMVAKMNRLHPSGVDMNAAGAEHGMAGTDETRAGFRAAGGVMHTKGKTAKMTAGSVQSALGMILSGCGGQGMGGQVVIDNVVYGLY